MPPTQKENFDVLFISGWNEFLSLIPFATLTELPGFPRFADESLSLLIGNTGRLVCHLPRAQPSLPTVNFYHNGIRLDLSDGKWSIMFLIIRRRVIYTH